MEITAERLREPHSPHSKTPDGHKGAAGQAPCPTPGGANHEKGPQDPLLPPVWESHKRLVFVRWHFTAIWRKTLRTNTRICNVYRAVRWDCHERCSWMPRATASLQRAPTPNTLGGSHITAEAVIQDQRLVPKGRCASTTHQRSPQGEGDREF